MELTFERFENDRWYVVLPDYDGNQEDLEMVDGAHYNVVGCDRFSGTIWLCNVTHFVFGEHPESIYCKVTD